MIAVYVDDLIVVANTIDEMANAKECLSRKFRMKELGRLQYCLGITIEQNEYQHYLKIVLGSIQVFNTMILVSLISQLL